MVHTNTCEVRQTERLKNSVVHTKVVGVADTVAAITQKPLFFAFLAFYARLSNTDGRILCRQVNNRPEIIYSNQMN